jgi:hypothetical protein
MDPVRPDVFIPSDDGMSDILHNAANAYTMYLDSDGKEDAMSIDPTVRPLNLRTDSGQIIQGPQLAYNYISLSPREHCIYIDHPICFDDF